MWWKGTNRKGPQAGKTYEERFWERVEKKSIDECWEWQAGKTPEDYGYIGVHGKSMPAHRMSYEMHIGPIPKGKVICHHCDNPPCVNPRHLFCGTNKDNQKDKIKKGRQARGETHGFYLHPEAVSQGEIHHKAKLTENDVIEIRRIFSSQEANRQELAKKYNVNWSTINRIVRGEIWKGIDHTIPHEVLNQPIKRNELGQWK